MSQEQWVIFAFKVVEIASVVTIAVFVGCYTRWTKGKCWTNPIGQTIIFKDIALILVLVPSLLSILINFNRLTSHIAAWFDVGSFSLVPAIMVWRVIAWRKIHKSGTQIDSGSTENSAPNPLYCSVDVKCPGSEPTPPGR